LDCRFRFLTEMAAGSAVYDDGCAVHKGSRIKSE
jgi:hypothetical protein